MTPISATTSVRIEQTMASDDDLAETAGILRSVPGIGPVASTMLIAEMPERGKRAIGGGRRQLRHVMFQAALVASHHNPHLKIFADRLRKAGKPHKVIITAVARKFVTIANALLKSRLKWTNQTA